MHDDADEVIIGGVLQRSLQVWLDGPWSIRILRVLGPDV
jgi:hypothetical protein